MDTTTEVTTQHNPPFKPQDSSVHGIRSLIWMLFYSNADTDSYKDTLAELIQHDDFDCVGDVHRAVDRFRDHMLYEVGCFVGRLYNEVEDLWDQDVEDDRKDVINRLVEWVENPRQN
jgi:hypothetical protein